MKSPLLYGLLWLLLSATPAGAQENLLKNSSFENGGASPVVGWRQVYPPGIQQPAPSFVRVEGDGGILTAKEGKAFGRIQTNKQGGFSSFTQGGRWNGKDNLLTLSSWVKVEEVDSPSAVFLLVLFVDGDGKQLAMEKTKAIAEKCDWVKLEREIIVPEGTEEWMVRCGVMGKASACFDDVQAIPSRLRGDAMAVQLAVHHGEYVIRTSGSKKDPWVSLSIPFPFARQMPLAIKVTTEPAGMVKELTVLEDRENRPLRVVMKKMSAGSEVKLRVETLTVVADRPTSAGEEIDLANPKKLPKDVRQHLKAAPGVDVKDKKIKAAAAGFSRDDFAAMMKDVQAYIRENLAYDVGNPQGAIECLDSGKAVCTGFANVAASLLIAAEVPTRILACTQLSGRLQEHYIVEAWTPELGWSRMESTMAAFPWRDTYNLILRVVYADSWRSEGDVPLFVEVSKGATGGYRMDPKDTCWQGADTLTGALLASKGFDAITKAASKNFQALVKKPSEGHAVRFAPETSAARKLKLDDRGRALLATVDDWLSD
jgi:hypothetical protein